MACRGTKERLRFFCYEGMTGNSMIHDDNAAVGVVGESEQAREFWDCEAAAVRGVR
jgi:hypothetical protein